MRRVVAALLLALLPLAPAAARSNLSPDQFADLAFREHPGTVLPLDAPLVDEQGNSVRLGQFFAGKPVVLVLDYLRCRTLCGAVLGNLADALDRVPLDAGKDFQVIAVSIDPRDTPQDALAAKAKDLARYHHPGAEAGWHFLTGEKAAVHRIAEAAGFPYRYDAAIDQYAHPAGIMLASADGRISRYLLGVDYRPAELRLGLGEAGKGRVTSAVSHLLLLCYGYDPQQGRFTPQIETAFLAVNLAGLAALVAIVAAIYRRRNG